MEEVEEMVEELLGEVMVVVEEGWSTVLEKTRSSVMLGLKNLEKGLCKDLFGALTRVGSFCKSKL